MKNSGTRSLQGPAFSRSWLQRIQQGAAVPRQELGHGSTGEWRKGSCSQGTSQAQVDFESDLRSDEERSPMT